MDLRLQVGYYMSRLLNHTLYEKAYCAKVKDIYNHAFWHIRFTDKNNRVKKLAKKKQKNRIKNAAGSGSSGLLQLKLVLVL